MLLLVACNASAGAGLADQPFGDPTMESSSGVTDGGTATDDHGPIDEPQPPAATAGDSAGDSHGGHFDLGSVPDADLDTDPCGRVDLLFVVDNSGSMGDEQQHLVASFPGFIDGIESILGDDTDYHVGVITTDENEFNGIGCRRIGALTTQTGGDLSSDAECGPYVGGFGYMTPQDALDESFACAAQVGIDGDGIERPMDAVAAALGVAGGNVMLCNDGFLRDDALLVLTIITDEEDDGQSEGDPATWYQTLVDFKGGDPSRVVPLSLVGHPKPNACIPAQWTGMMGAEIATRIIEFTGMFEHGRVGDICADEYGAFFAESLIPIAQACDVVIPVG